MGSKKTVLVVLALASAAALAVGSGGDDDDDKLPDLPPPPDDDENEPVDPDAPTVPIPTPTPDPPLPGVKDGAGVELDNVHELELAADFARWGVLDAVEPNGEAGNASSFVLLGYDVGWVGRPLTLDLVRELAATHPDTTFVVFDFSKSKRFFGQPDQPIGYIATAVGPDGRARPMAMLGRKKTLGPLSEQRLLELIRYASSGPTAQQDELRRFVSKNNRPYVAHAYPKQGQWEWKVWANELGDANEAVSGGRQATKALAFEAAQVYVMGAP